jgi:thymidylate synthase (FAD)
MRTKVLDFGYVEFVESWGSDERIVEAARMSTSKGFLGWGPTKCLPCNGRGGWEDGDDAQWVAHVPCNGTGAVAGDEKLLAYLYANKHATPFEMAGMVIEVQSPIVVFREWHRHRTQCLAPGTLIHFDAPKSRENRRYVYKMRIEDIWRKWQPTVRRNRPERQKNSLFPRSRIQAMQLRCANEHENEIGHTYITDVICGDPKPMVRIVTASGKSITATREHRFLTADGWTTLGEAIKSGAMLAVEGVERGKAMGWETPSIDESLERWTAVIGWETFYEVSNMGRVRRINCSPRKLVVGANGYLVVGLNRPGEQILRTVHSLVAEAFLGCRPAGHEVRHADHNRLNPIWSNLSYGPPEANASDRVEADRNQRLVVNFEEIVQVDDIGELPTFDLSVNGPWHNFVAEGFVVHNSYNEMSARYTPLPDVNYMPTPERCLSVSGTNRQAGAIKGADEVTHESALEWLEELADVYAHAERVYQSGLRRGIPKEVARLPVPVGRYSRMRASANLRNWLAFLTLRMDAKAQWEIRQFANEVGSLIAAKFPRTWELFASKPSASSNI